MTRIDVLVVGAGVTGLASAAAIAARGLSTCIVEIHPRPGLESSTHNSGVIHAGLYYPPGSLKARLCVEGREALYAFCDRHGVPVRRTGKLVVADDRARESELEAIAANARANGARAELLTRDAIRALAPDVEAPSALWSRDTGIVDASQLVLALAAHAKAAGAILLTQTKLVSASADTNGFVCDTGREQIRAGAVVNGAGLFADEISRMFAGEDFRIWACRGDYAELSPRLAAKFTIPVYPLPERSGHGLGVHFTPTMAGTVMLGPTSRYQESKTDYESNRPALTEFLAAAQRLVPAIALGDLRDGPSGLRAKLHPPHERFADFMIRRDARVPRLVHAAGIDSPGLTSCLAIGAMVADLVSGA